MELSKDIIRAAADRNILVYDNLLVERVVSARIIELLKQVASETCGFKVTEAFIPNDRPRIRNAWECLGFSVKFTEDRRLNWDGELTKYYLDELKAMLPSGSDCLVVATDGTECLLGAV